MCIGLALIVYAKTWKIWVKKDVITARLPLRKTRVIHIDEITAVKQRRTGLIIYANGKKFASIDAFMSEFTMFFAQLKLAGKIDDEKKTDYSIRQHGPT